MSLAQVRIGETVRTADQLGSTKGIILPNDSLMARTPSLVGVVIGYVGGHGGDVLFVQHSDGVVAPYLFNELDPMGNAIMDAPMPEGYRKVD